MVYQALPLNKATAKTALSKVFSNIQRKKYKLSLSMKVYTVFPSIYPLKLSRGVVLTLLGKFSA